MPPPDADVRRHTHVYVDGSTRFEQSLDVYLPAHEHIGAPLVVLVVGSGWLGHRPPVYNFFNKENAAGPRTIAALGCVCVAVRHRGAFIQAPNATLSVLIAAVALLLWGLPALLVFLATGIFFAMFGWRPLPTAAAQKKFFLSSMSACMGHGLTKDFDTYM